VNSLFHIKPYSKGCGPRPHRLFQIPHCHSLFPAVTAAQ
jgi:hypothetical protein